MVQISPPERNARTQSFTTGEGGEAAFTAFAYSCGFAVFIMDPPF